MNVMYSGDRGISRGVLLSLLSIYEANPEMPLDVWIVTAHIDAPERTFEPITDDFVIDAQRAMRERGAQIRITKADVTAQFAAEPPTANIRSYFTPCCMLRLYADLVEDIPGRILYLDYDVLCASSMAALERLDLGSGEVAGVLDNYGRWFFHSRGLRMDYLNSGVLLLNMNEIRRTGMFARCRRLCATNWMFMPDQSAINKQASRKIFLPRAFNEQGKLRPDTVMHHFSTSFALLPVPHMVMVKPWQVDKVHRVLKLHAYDDLLQDFEGLLEQVSL
jgi:lipopolysaccharide biosynthesis glycosyltransferase